MVTARPPEPAKNGRRPVPGYQPPAKVPAAFEQRCIPPDCVVRRLHMPNLRPPHAGYRVSERLAALGATRGFTTGCYAFGRVFSGSNTAAATAATVTGKHSFMYSTCNSVPATACSIGR